MILWVPERFSIIVEDLVSWRIALESADGVGVPCSSLVFVLILLVD